VLIHLSATTVYLPLEKNKPRILAHIEQCEDVETKRFNNALYLRWSDYIELLARFAKCDVQKLVRFYSMLIVSYL
jgi:hypothetical protein